MSDDFIKTNLALEKQVKAKQLILENISNKLGVAIVGLEAVISNNCDTLKIAEKTLQEIGNIKLPPYNAIEE